MEIADPAGALDAVQSFIRLLEDHKRCFGELGHTEDLWASAKGTRIPAVDEMREQCDKLNATIRGQVPLVEAIGERVDQRSANGSFREGPEQLGWPWEFALASAHRLVGILERTAEEEAILGPGGPKLAAGGMHPWVWNAAVDLWDGDHHRQAVSAAAAALEQQTQLKLGRGDLSGADLYTEAFKVDKPGTVPSGGRLRFAHLPELSSAGGRNQTWTSAHEGAMHFGRGCAQGIRNLSVHGTEELGEQEALEHLASLSVLARWIDDAVVHYG